MTDPDLIERLNAIEARMAELEGVVFRSARPPSKPLRLLGFAASEPVTLTIGHPQSEVESPTGLVEASDSGGAVIFDLSAVRLDPMRPPDLRLWRGRGQRSGRVVQTPVRPSPS